MELPNLQILVIEDLSMTLPPLNLRCRARVPNATLTFLVLARERPSVLEDQRSQRNIRVVKTW